MPSVHKPVLCLASVSPRRQELLAQIGVPHSVVGAHIDEKVMPAESAREYVIRMAREKALAVRAKGEQLPVLAADTTVVLDEVIFGKPKGRADGLAMLGRLSGRTHSVLTAVALSAGGELAVSVSASEVRFRPLSAQECAAYWETGEPHDKAGAYAIQGRGAVFIEWLSGSYSGVMGLPLYETAELLRAAGVSCWDGASR
jgi:septum formation protein